MEFATEYSKFFFQVEIWRKFAKKNFTAQKLPLDYLIIQD